ncbi:unnamed protein product [Fraxinus pennsylvanica]|uniref:Uncharacterized protein n=1 Tax=Fraxinus pennsylvanica TaxID=56036 RepID=A0AAD1ZRT0_9LAMI|nr:unnamed protein product [Fraxinus pennsylvanica]
MKVGISELLNGVGEGVEQHIETLESEFSDLQKLLIDRTRRLKKIDLKCQEFSGGRENRSEDFKISSSADPKAGIDEAHALLIQDKEFWMRHMLLLAANQVRSALVGVKDQKRSVWYELFYCQRTL